MALLKDLIVQGASRFIGDAYFATIKAGVWNGTPIDLSHGGTAGETTAGKILTSTTTSGTSAWTAASSITVGTATTATKLSTVSKTAWGLTYWTSGGVPTDISGAMSSVTTISMSGLLTNTVADGTAPMVITSKTVVSNLNVDQVDGKDASDFVKYGGNQNSSIGLNSAAANCKSWVTSTNLPNGNALVYNSSGAEYSILFTLHPTSLNYGNILKWGYTDKYIYMLRRNAGSWQTTDWEKISAGYADSASSSTNATYAANVGAAGTAGTNYVTAATVIATCNWYDTMIASSDTDALINRWNEVVDFLNNFTEADTLASVLSTYVTLGTAQTITGAKTFANPISGDLLGNATTADRLKSTTAVGGAGTPVYFTGGLPVACTAANVRTFLGLGTVYSHAHTDYVTNVSFDPTNRKLQLSKGGGTASDIVTFGTAYSKNIDNSTTGYAAYYSAASTVSGTPLLQFDTTNSIVTIKSTTYTPLEIWRNNSGFSAIRYCNGETKTVLGHIGIASLASTVAPNRPYWSTGESTPVYYQLVHSSPNANVGSSTTAPVYIDANGQAQVCTSLNINTSGSAGSIKTVTRSTNSTHYLTFVDSDNSTATAESIYTDAGITYNPSTNLLTVEKLTASGVVNLSGSTTIDSLTAGNLTVTGASTLTGNVSMGTVTAGTWNGSIIDVAHGGTGCSTLTSGSALIGNGTGAVTFRSIDDTTSVGSLVNLTTWANSSNLVTRNTIARWDGRYQTTSNSSNLAYCNKGAFGDATTRTYATAISTASGTTSATVNNYNSDTYVPTNKAVYNYVTSTLGVAATIEKTSITKSLNSSTWTETGYTLYGEEQGSYMLQITDTTTAAVFTGVFSVYHGSSATGNDLDEIPLHMCASVTNKVRIYAATLNGKLLVSSQDTSATNHTLTIKYKKII